MIPVLPNQSRLYACRKSSSSSAAVKKINKKQLSLVTTATHFPCSFFEAQSLRNLSLQPLSKWHSNFPPRLCWDLAQELFPVRIKMEIWTGSVLQLSLLLNKFQRTHLSFIDYLQVAAVRGRKWRLGCGVFVFCLFFSYLLWWLLRRSGRIGVRSGFQVGLVSFPVFDLEFQLLFMLVRIGLSGRFVGFGFIHILDFGSDLDWFLVAWAAATCY